MVTAQVNAVSPVVTSKTKVQPVKTDASFSDILNKESATNKSGTKEAKNSIVSEKFYKDDGKVSNDDNQDAVRLNERVSPAKDDKSAKTKDSSYQVNKKNSDLTDIEETNDGEENDAKAKTLMEILASMFADISSKTGIDEDTIKDYIAGNNLTSANLPDINSWKALVTEVNGLNDISAILTNDEAFKDLEDISDIINAYLDEMGQMTAGMTEGVTDEKGTESIVKIPEAIAVKTDELLAGFVKGKGLTTLDSEQEVSDKEAVKTGEVKEELKAFVMTDNNGIEKAKTESGFEQNTSNSKGNNQNNVEKTDGISSQNIFDNIAANLQKLERTNSLPEGTTVRDILNQVTSQIKNLHAPDKTSLEFMLTPETLGKVAVNVSSRNGILQAEFRVETAQAKAALESQIADLKLNFENQGLKVETVSVMISENGIGQDDGGKNTGDDGKKSGNRRNRNFSIDGEEGIESLGNSSEEAIKAYTDEDTGSNINLGA